MCRKQEIITEADTVDHVKPHRGDPALFWHGELQSLCASCHSMHKQREEHGNVRPIIGVDGYPVEYD
jgi:5-methylcytosine-specific restriction endonuclease McrA